MTTGPAPADDHVDRMVAAWARAAPTLNVEPLQIAGRLLRLTAGLQRDIDQALSELDITFGDFDVINTLRREADPDGINPTRLARSCLITSGAMTTRLGRLERLGLLTRTADPDDRRAVRVHLTDAGVARADAAVRLVLAVDRQLLEPLGPRERRTVAAGLRKLLRNRER